MEAYAVAVVALIRVENVFLLVICRQNVKRAATLQS